ncbi:MAG: SUMF1/EgtB/PvdO family nonheme iron enzyme [Nitrosomonas sp.]|uniref:SUMF1/EgtB/PvdO family nonheme iron enzyme n=1 Tax=Nitrosomonas sp. TaxID=42353 RepID=UPI00273204B1|nr:SUMF1/EgtB/PvdO family nonheme iron enzyme [Nitrosomonas sp.]MDP1550862.1 SUMF1/EgtB/PvdO family nonheme iron enzyme [Nitrosomonas sp.]
MSRVVFFLYRAMMRGIPGMLCFLIAFLTVAETVMAQNIDTLRSGIVKLVSTVDGKQKTGTGFVVRHVPGSTLIVTAAHVVEGDKFPQVEFYTLRNTLIKAEVLEMEGGDPRGIALLRIRDGAQVPQGVTVLPFASLDEVQDGEDLITIGFPREGGLWAVLKANLASRHGRDLRLSGTFDEGSSGAPILKNGKIAGLMTSMDRFGHAIPAEIVAMTLRGWGVVLGENQQRRSVNSTQASQPGMNKSADLEARQPSDTRLPFEPEMVHIPPGKLMMGSADSFDDEKPQHEVTIAYAFEISKYEVTFDEYDAFAKSTNRALPDDRGRGRGKRPVINVNFDDVLAYVQWLSNKTGKQYRLPSEAEWEYAARAGTQTAYWWGNNIGKNNAVCDGCGSQWDNKQTAPVGSFKPNAFELYDTAGNVWEWTQDCWHGNYQNAPNDGSAWMGMNGGDCNRRVVRGGSWFGNPQILQSAVRYRYDTVEANGGLGFRIARAF